MILPTLFCALKARDAFVFRVTVGERSEVYATREAATKAAATFDHLAPIGHPVAIITRVRARELPELREVVR